MATTLQNADEIVRRGKQIQATLEPALLPEHRGEFLAIDVGSGDSECALTALDAHDRLKARRENAEVFIGRVGFPAAYNLGGHLRTRRP